MRIYNTDHTIEQSKHTPSRCPRCGNEPLASVRLAITGGRDMSGDKPQPQRQPSQLKKRVSVRLENIGKLYTEPTKPEAPNERAIAAGWVAPWVMPDTAWVDVYQYIVKNTDGVGPNLDREDRETIAAWLKSVNSNATTVSIRYRDREYHTLFFP